jgi:DNA-binding transcriptional LysR family regulator
MERDLHLPCLSRIDIGVGAPMEISQIRYFLATCRALNFTAAARSCGVSQPTLSLAIKSLEQEFGQPLFDRRRPVQLTDFGRRIYPQLKEIMESVEKVAAMAKSESPDSAHTQERRADVKTTQGERGCGR